MARQSVALFGGSFNPPHVGHVLAIAHVLSTELCQQVLVVPVFEHALRKQLAPFEHRVEMSRRAFDWLPRTQVSTIEERLGAPSRTLRTVIALQAEHPDWDLRLMVGSDILGEIHQWHAFDEIERRAPPLVLRRAGSSAGGKAPSLLPQISSTEVRNLLGAAEQNAAELTQLVPRAVLEYVRENALYRSVP